MLSRFDELVETVGFTVPALAAALLARRWWLRRRVRPQGSRSAAANDDASAGGLHDEPEPQWPASFEVAETCRRINRNMAESAYKARRGCTVVVELDERRRMAGLVHALRCADDATAWAVLEPITASGEVVGLIESLRKDSGEFSAQSLRLCIERLWSQRVARDSGERDAAPSGRRGDPGAGGLPPA